MTARYESLDVSIRLYTVLTDLLAIPLLCVDCAQFSTSMLWAIVTYEGCWDYAGTVSSSINGWFGSGEYSSGNLCRVDAFAQFGHDFTSCSVKLVKIIAWHSLKVSLAFATLQVGRRSLLSGGGGGNLVKHPVLLFCNNIWYVT